MAAASRGERWETVYRRHVVPVYRLMYSRVGNARDAENLTSQVFLAALPRLRTGVSDAEIEEDLVAAAGSVLADHWSARFHVPLTFIDDEQGARELRGQVAPEQRRDRRTGNLPASLPPDHRSILELRFVSGCSIRESATRIGISAGEATTLQYRALRRAGELSAATDQPG